MGHVVVIGAGQAAASLVARLRGKGFEGEITMIGAEAEPPYQRPPLSKAYLLGEMEKDRLYLRPRTYYDEQTISLMLGEPAVSVDTRARHVIAGGREIAYDELVFCTGSAPRRLPPAIGGELDGVCVVRGIADVDSMRARFKAGARVLIVGGGYIGLEAAAVASKLGLQVTLVEMADRILQRVAAPETSDWFRALHKGHGVDLREGVGLGKLVGEDGKVTAAELTDGTTLPVDFVIVGVGILPETSVAEAAGIEIENGIRTDAFGRCSAPHVWAAGDCASFPMGDAQLRLESVGNAIDQAEAVADNIMGAEAPYQPKPWFWSDQYDVKLQIAGLNAGYDKVVVRDGAAGPVSHWYYREGKLIALDAMNDPRAYMVGKRLIEAGKSADPEVVADAGSDLKALMKA
ncbi:NAD(P)/FAD-dependent oxidoreductase [Alloyangia pacifica]|uniref:NAD(P)/FAD-dependent oxidoreductase n=1 Tax=Alloyangia pacifica TaxID=311180 RepID=UPI0031E3D196